jgi:hypothetical protein
MLAYPAPGNPDEHGGDGSPLPWTGGRTVAYWTEGGRDRTELLQVVAARLAEHRWGRAIDSGWTAWDLAVSGDRYTSLQLRTAQEEHGGGKRLIRVRYRMHPRGLFWVLAGLWVALSAATAIVNPILAAAPAATGLGALVFAWWRGRRTAGKAVRLVEAAATELGLIPCREGE